MLNTGMSWTMLQPLFHQEYIRWLSGDTDLNITVRKVAYPALQAKPAGFDLGVVAEAYSLNASTDPGCQ